MNTYDNYQIKALQNVKRLLNKKTKSASIELYLLINQCSFHNDAFRMIRIINKILKNQINILED